MKKKNAAKNARHICELLKGVNLRTRIRMYRRLITVPAFRTNVRLMSNFHPISMHRDSEGNTPETYFDFTPDNYKRVKQQAIKIT